jgi:hypothetical protein
MMKLHHLPLSALLVSDQTLVTTAVLGAKHLDAIQRHDQAPARRLPVQHLIALELTRHSVGQLAQRIQFQAL